MQTIYEDKNERYISRRVGTVYFVICVEGISGYMKGDKKFKRWKYKFCNSREVFNRLEERFQKRKQWNNKDGEAEEGRAKGKNSGGICIRV